MMYAYEVSGKCTNCIYYEFDEGTEVHNGLGYEQVEPSFCYCYKKQKNVKPKNQYKCKYYDQIGGAEG